MTSILFILFVTIQTIIAQQTGITCSNVIPIDVPRFVVPCTYER